MEASGGWKATNMKMRKKSSRIEDLEVAVMMGDKRPTVVLGCMNRFLVEIKVQRYQ